MADENTRTTYDVVTQYGKSTFPTLGALQKYLARTSFMTPIKRVIEVTRKDIELPDFVVEANKRHEEDMRKREERL